MENLCRKTREITKRKRVGKEELLEAIDAVEQELNGLSIHCSGCLRERLKQKKLCEEAYNRGLLNNTIRSLSYVKYCEHKKTCFDADILYCVECSTVLCNDVNEDGDYLSHKVKHRGFK